MPEGMRTRPEARAEGKPQGGLALLGDAPAAPPKEAAGRAWAGQGRGRGRVPGRGERQPAVGRGPRAGKRPPNLEPWEPARASGGF